MSDGERACIFSEAAGDEEGIIVWYELRKSLYTPIQVLLEYGSDK